MFAVIFLLTWLGLPLDQESYGYEILATGSFFEGETESQNGELWLGLFTTNQSYELRTVELTVSAEHSLADRLYGNKQKTGKSVSVTGEEGTLLFLLRSQNNTFVEGAVFPTIVGSEDLEIGVSIPAGENTEIFTTSDGLFLTDETITQRLSNVYPDSYGEGVAVVWAGDLDGDNKIDIILDDQPHYAFKHFYRLFLSSEATDDELVKEVAQFVTVSC